MDVLLGCAGLSIAFLLLATIVLYFVIKTKGHYVMKGIVVALTLYYSLILLYTPDKLLGWPTNDPMPPNTIILYILFDEPKPGEKGSIYLWAITRDPSIENPILDQLNYKGIFRYNVLGVPRVYRIPYTKKNHQILYNMWVKAMNQNMYLMFSGSGGDRDRLGTEENPLTLNQFEVINKFEPSPDKEEEDS